MDLGIGLDARAVRVAQSNEQADAHSDARTDDRDRDEAALIVAAQTDPAAFATLYRRYLPRVYRYVRAHTASDEDAADLTQQAFLSALDALPAYRDRGAPFAAWLFRIARNAAVDAARRQHPSVAWEAVPEALHPADAREPEGDLLRREDLARLDALLRRLDPAKRELLALRFAAGLSAPEIAAVVGKQPEAVKKQLTRILQALKEQYRDA